MAKTLSFMSYNVENLFDTHHDNMKNDWTYLPLSHAKKRSECNKNKSFYRKRECLETNWTKKKLHLKISQIKKVVSQNKNLPDFLALTEIENSNVVAQLAKALGYQHFEITNSPDKRGVDVALLYRVHKDIKKISHKEHELSADYFKKKPTRNILEVEFLINNKFPLTIFVNHWPSLSNPTKTRLHAAKVLNSRIKSILENNKKHRVIAAGDFNTIDSNHPHPFKDTLLKNLPLVDLHESFMKDRRVDKSLKKMLPLGSYFYANKMAWNHLDRIFYSKNLLRTKGLALIKKSYRIMAAEFMTTTYIYEKREHYLYGSKVKATPFSYDHKASKEKLAGFSDHFPLFIRLEY